MKVYLTNKFVAWAIPEESVFLYANGTYLAPFDWSIVTIDNSIDEEVCENEFWEYETCGLYRFHNINNEA